MFYHFLYPLREFFFGFNVFRYITFRAAMASITAFVVSLILGPWVIRFLHDLDSIFPIHDSLLKPKTRLRKDRRVGLKTSV